MNLTGPVQSVVTPRTEWMCHCQRRCSEHFNPSGCSPYPKEAEGHSVFPDWCSNTEFLVHSVLTLVILENTWDLSPSVRQTSSLLTTGPDGCNDFWSALQLLSFGQNFVSFFKGSNNAPWSEWMVCLQDTACACCDYFQLNYLFFSFPQSLVLLMRKAEAGESKGRESPKWHIGWWEWPKWKEKKK